jgi:D-beta-D-heptose 7-phosphate kinase/D-beta-D-heptose 1-phosphate adenosyltransferase
MLPEHYLPIIDQFAGLPVLCVGDLMLDRFMYGTVDRISPESPIPIFSHTREERMLGGAGNVVRNLLSLGAEATLVAVIGDDAVGNQLTALVGNEAHLLPYLISEKGRISTKKTRYVASGQQLLRADHETKTPILSATEARIRENVLSELPRQKALILSDYGKGVLTPHLCRELINAARTHGVPVLVDPKQRDISVYAGATVLSPNLKELAAASGVESFADDAAMIAAASALCAAHDISFVLVTRGKDGMVLADKHGSIASVPASAHEVFDVSGAGDTAIATLALALATGSSVADAMILANLAAGIVVGRLGTAVVYRTDLTSSLYLQQSAEKQRKILPLSVACDVVAGWKREGLRVGFTNGCFDIMHAGHVTLLQDAKANCDRLIVGMNSDASVSRLKGPTRPVNHDTDRAQLLAALSMVDMVILFEEDTPLALLEALKPNLLMKGADYTKDNVVGWQMVEAYGGKVVLLPLKEGYSTTGIIEKMAAGAR